MASENRHLIDSIYEAALVPSLWPALLADLSKIVGGETGVMFAGRGAYSIGIVSPGWEEILDRFLRHWAYRDPLMPKAIASSHAGFLTDLDLVSEDVIADNEVYRDFYRPFGLGYRATTSITMPDEDTISLTLPRHHRHGPISASVVQILDSYRPHLARAAITANRLGFDRARVQADAMQALGLPGAVLRAQGSVLAANESFVALMPTLFQDRAQRLFITDTAVDGLFADELAKLSISPTRKGISIPIAAAMGRLPMVLHLVPVRGRAHDIFTQAAALLIVTAVDRAAVPTAQILQGLFDLTPAEARIARAIGQARSIDDIALAHGTTRETVRSHLKTIMFKTGVSRQQELVSLLAGKALPILR